VTVQVALIRGTEDFFENFEHGQSSSRVDRERRRSDRLQLDRSAGTGVRPYSMAVMSGAHVGTCKHVSHES
jgi:hypothetical protein